MVAAGDDENDHLEDETTTYLCSIACRYFCAHHTAAETQSSWRNTGGIKVKCHFLNIDTTSETLN